MESFILYLGLPALFLGMLLEGELLFITGIVLAKAGQLSLPGILIAVLLGAMSHDWIFYSIGKSQGSLFFEKRPYLQKKLDKIVSSFHKNPWILFISYRFLIGFRMIILVLFGLSGVPTKKFFAVSILSNFLWISFYGLMGYYFANTAINHLEWVSQNKIWIISSCILLVIFYKLSMLLAHHWAE